MYKALGRVDIDTHMIFIFNRVNTKVLGHSVTNKERESNGKVNESFNMS